MYCVPDLETLQWKISVVFISVFYLHNCSNDYHIPCINRPSSASEESYYLNHSFCLNGDHEQAKLSPCSKGMRKTNVKPRKSVISSCNNSGMFSHLLNILSIIYFTLTIPPKSLFSMLYACLVSRWPCLKLCLYVKQGATMKSSIPRTRHSKRIERHLYLNHLHLHPKEKCLLTKPNGKQN